jgi:hypothetical protein
LECGKEGRSSAAIPPGGGARLELLAIFVRQAVFHAREVRIEQSLALAERAYAIAPANPSSVGLMAGLLRRTGDVKRSEQLL